MHGIHPLRSCWPPNGNHFIISKQENSLYWYSIVSRASSYSTRQSDLLPIIRADTNWGRKSIAYRGEIVWNALTESTRNINNLKSFKLGLTKEEMLIGFSFAQGVSLNRNKDENNFYF